MNPQNTTHRQHEIFDSMLNMYFQALELRERKRKDPAFSEATMQELNALVADQYNDTILCIPHGHFREIAHTLITLPKVKWYKRLYYKALHHRAVKGIINLHKRAFKF